MLLYRGYWTESRNFYFFGSTLISSYFRYRLVCSKNDAVASFLCKAYHAGLPLNMVLLYTLMAMVGWKKFKSGCGQIWNN